MPTSDNPFITAPGSALSRLGRPSAPAVSPASLYDDWLIAETEASLALAAWRCATRADGLAAYAGYVAATDAEEAAAARLQNRISQGA